MKRILIFGTGVIGSIYAGKLALAGNNVTVLARNLRLQELKGKGLLLSEINKKTLKIDVTVISELKYDDIYDFVFIILRNDHVEPALPALSQNMSKNIVFMVNTPTGYSEWINQIGVGRIIPAFPGAGGKLVNGIVQYTLTSKLIQPTTIGEIDGKTTDRLIELIQMFKNAGFPVSISKNMDSWQKSHVAMVCPLAFGIYLDGGNNYSFSKNKSAVTQVSKALKEAFYFLRHSGIGILPLKLNLFRLLPIQILNCLISLIFKTTWAETVISNHALSARNEMEMLYNGFIALADNAGYNLIEFKKLRK